MNVFRCHRGVEHGQTEPLLRFEKPVELTAPIARAAMKNASLTIRDAQSVKDPEGEIELLINQIGDNE